MDIDIHHPELEALIQQRMASGAFHDVEDALLNALKSAPPPKETVKSSSNEMSLVSQLPGSRRENFLTMLDSVRGLLTDEEVDTLFARDRSVDRPIDLS